MFHRATLNYGWCYDKKISSSWLKKGDYFNDFQVEANKKVNESVINDVNVKVTFYEKGNSISRLFRNVHFVKFINFLQGYKIGHVEPCGSYK